MARNPYKSRIGTLTGNLLKNLSNSLQRVPILGSTFIDYSRGPLVRWGIADDLPQRAASVIYGSHVANACYNTLLDYAFGNGFTDKSLADSIVGKKGESMNDFLKKILAQLIMFDACSVFVTYDPTKATFGESEIMHLEYLSVDQLRFRRPDENGKIHKIAYNPFFGTKESESLILTKDFNLFDPNELPNQINKENGLDGFYQVYFWGEQRPLQFFYPIPKWYGWFDGGGQSWCLADKSMGEFHANNTENNFFLGTIIQITGDPDEPVETDKNNNVIRTLRDDMEAQINQLSGSKSAGGTMLLWNKTGESAVKIDPLQSNNNDKVFEVLYDQTTESICRAFGVPPILAGIQVSGKLGNTQEILNSVQLINLNVKSYQERAIKIFKELAKYFPKISGYEDFSIKNLSPVSFIDDKIWSVLTIEEQREWANRQIDIDLTLEKQEKQEKEIQNIQEAVNQINLLPYPSVPFVGRNIVFSEYQQFVNLNYSQVFPLYSEPCFQIGISPQAQKQILDTLRKQAWADIDYSTAAKMVSVIKQVQKIEGELALDLNCPPQKEVLLKLLGNEEL